MFLKIIIIWKCIKIIFFIFLKFILNNLKTIKKQLIYYKKKSIFIKKNKVNGTKTINTCAPLAIACSLGMYRTILASVCGHTSL